MDGVAGVGFCSRRPLCPGLATQDDRSAQVHLCGRLHEAMLVAHASTHSLRHSTHWLATTCWQEPVGGGAVSVRINIIFCYFLC